LSVLPPTLAWPPSRKLGGRILAGVAFPFFFGACSASWAQEPPAPPEPMRVEEVRFEGLLTWQAEELAPRLATKAGQPFNPVALREDLSRLAQLMRRVDVRTEPVSATGLRVTFVVVEFPRLRKLSIIGNASVSDERIEYVAKVKPGDVLDEMTVRSLRNALRQEYQRRGLTRARIEVKETLIPMPIVPEAQHPQADLAITIDEGEKVYVDDVKIEGSKAFPTLRLKILMSTKGSWLFLKNYFDEEQFEEDLVRLRGFYAAHGYFDAVIQRGSFSDRREKGRLVVTPVILIQEGGKYQLESVEARGARLFAREEIIEPFAKLLGQDFDGRRFMRALEEAKGLYDAGGFLTTEIKPVYEYDAARRQLRAVLEITERDRIYVGQVRLQRKDYKAEEEPSWFGRFYERIAPPVSEEAIKREVLLKPGEVYNKRQERETLRRLRRLEIFSDVGIVNQPTANPRVHDALVSVDETATGGIIAGIGFGDVSGAFAFASFNERNLFGEARDLRGQIQIGTRASSFSLRYQDRFFRDTEDTFTAALYYNVFRRTGYREAVAGTSVEIAHPLYGDWERAVRGRLEFVRLRERDGFDAREDLDVSYPVVAARLRLTQDTRYPFAQPTEGRLLNGAVEIGWADGPLIKFTGEGDYYYELGPRLTYRFNPMIGFLPYNANVVGLSERFFLGGTDDLRGFKFRGAGRRDEDEEEIGIGGAVKILARNELLFPLYDPVGGVFFVDIGTLGKNPFSYEFPRLSTGVGLRLAMDRVTVAVDFALPVIAGGGDQKQFIHFSFKGSL